MKKILTKAQIAPLVYLMSKILFRMTLFSFLLLVALCLFYSAGNFQAFLDSSQAIILNGTIFMAITLFFFALISIVFTILDSVLSKFYSWKKTVSIIFYSVCTVFAFVCGIVARGLTILTTGYY